MNDSFSPDIMYAKVLEAGMDWADKKAAYEALDDATKTVLAGLKLAEAFPEGIPGQLVKSRSNAEAETHALSSRNYRDHLAVKSDARKAWLHAEVQYKALIALAEWRRSQEATRRAEARIV